MILSVKKAMDIVDTIAQKGRMSIKELSKELQIPKSTVCRLAQTLEASGYLEQDPLSDDYLLSFKFFRVGYDLIEKSGIRSCVLPVIKRLSEQTNENVNFTILDDAEVLYIEKVERPLTHGGIQVGSRGPLHCTASGKIMLANLSPDRLKTVLAKAQPFQSYSNQTIVTIDKLLAELDDLREKGYAVCIDELGNGYNAIASFVEGYPGRDAAAVSIAGPQNRFSKSRLIELSKHLIPAVKEISRRFQS